MKKEYSKFNLCQVTVLRPRGKFRFATIWEAMDTIKKWVWIDEAIRIVEADLGL